MTVARFDDWRRGPRTLGRRAALAAVATGLVGGVAGCSGEPSFPDADVIVAPDGRLAFEPAELTVRIGDAVTWGFASSGHNVSCRPSDNGEVELPDDAEPFASYGLEESPEASLVPRGGTYEYAFKVPGRYVYVCVPHDREMVGTIRVQ